MSDKATELPFCEHFASASLGTGPTAHIEIWILDGAGIAAATNSTFAVAWDSAPSLPMYSRAFFAGVDQTTPTGDERVESSSAATPNPIVTKAVATSSGDDMVVVGAVAGNDGAYAPQNSFTLGNNQTASTTVTDG